MALIESGSTIGLIRGVQTVFEQMRLRENETFSLARTTLTLYQNETSRKWDFFLKTENETFLKKVKMRLLVLVGLLSIARIVQYAICVNHKLLITIYKIYVSVNYVSLFCLNNDEMESRSHSKQGREGSKSWGQGPSHVSTFEKPKYLIWNIIYWNIII